MVAGARKVDDDVQPVLETTCDHITGDSLGCVVQEKNPRSCQFRLLDLLFFPPPPEMVSNIIEIYMKIGMTSFWRSRACKVMTRRTLLMLPEERIFWTKIHL